MNDYTSSMIEKIQLKVLREQYAETMALVLFAAGVSGTTLFVLKTIYMFV